MKDDNDPGGLGSGRMENDEDEMREDMREETSKPQ
jgi:hypothetical protein